jgi:N-acetylneuraminic acid mutarotase
MKTTSLVSYAALALALPFAAMQPGCLATDSQAETDQAPTAEQEPTTEQASAVVVAGWAASPTSLVTARTQHTATRLNDGRVLVAGGSDGTNALWQAEICSADMTTCTATAHMVTKRFNHAAVLLPSGRVLVIGGEDGTNIFSSAEEFDPSASPNPTWTAVTINMSGPRSQHIATLLATGNVLVAGGRIPTGSGVTATADVYTPGSTPGSGTWTSAGSMSNGRKAHAAVLLSSGKVLVAGGHDGTASSSTVDLYDPATGGWSATGAMPTARRLFTLTALTSGKVLAAGGQGISGSGTLNKAEIYDPAGTWSTTTPAMVTNRQSHVATLLASGKVLVAGGNGTSGSIVSTTELFDPIAGTWSSAGSMNTARASAAAVVLRDGRVAVTGGFNTAALAANEIYEPGDALVPSACNLEQRTGHNYLFCTTASKWVDARTTCLGSSPFDLASLEDSNENKWTVDTAVMNYPSTDKWWAGANDNIVASGWNWAATSASISFSSWHTASSEPNSPSTDHCMELTLWAGSADWNDNRCYNTNRFVCESK